MAGNVFDGRKSALRRVAEARRRARAPDEVVKKGGEAQGALAALPLFKSAQVVALYAAQPFEVPTEALHAQVLVLGHRVVYPRVVKGQRMLEFCEVSALATLVVRGGLREPNHGAPSVALIEISLFVVPGVAFTLDGDRLGRGGGYYDATLTAARPDAFKVGLTFSDCIEDSVPVSDSDVQMDAIVSDEGLSMVNTVLARRSPYSAKFHE
jgi:5-formyltetrahydrofolate cyclo-ligase